MIAARPCVLRFVSLTHTHTTLSLKGTGDRKGARAAGQAGNQHVRMNNFEQPCCGNGERILYGVCSRPDGLFSHDIPHPMRMMPTAPGHLPRSIYPRSIYICPCPIVHVSLIMPSSRIIVLSSCVRGSFPTREGRSSCARRRRRGARPCAARPVASQPLRNYSKNR